MSISNRNRIVGSWLAGILASALLIGVNCAQERVTDSAVGSATGSVALTDDFLDPPLGESAGTIRFANTRLLQDQPALIPRLSLNIRTQTPAETNVFVRDFFSTYQVGRSLTDRSSKLGNINHVDLILGVG